jgi:predicted dehydrogenase
MRKAKVGIIGTGFMGRTHGEQLKRLGNVELAAIAGLTDKMAADLGAILGVERTTGDYKTLLADPEIDAVHVLTPNALHAPMSIQALQAGKAVLCEKPLANNVADAVRMRDAVVRARVPNAVCHNYRRAPAVALAKRLVEAGRLGPIHHWRGTYLQDWIVDPAFPRVWRLQKEHAGSGALGDIASHSIDLARYIVGEITEVSGLLETFVPERPLPEGGGMGKVDVDDAALALVRFAGGAIGTIEGTRFAPGRKNQNRFEVNGSRGSLAFDLERMNELELYEEAGPESGFRTILATDASHPYVAAWWPPGHGLGYEHTFVHTVHDFVQAVATGAVMKPDFEDGLANQRVLDAVERSAASRRWEKV